MRSKESENSRDNFLRDAHHSFCVLGYVGFNEIERHVFEQ